MENDNDFGNFLMGFIIGGMVGAAAALLWAPQSGEETRAQIREKSIELKDRAMETYEDTRLRTEKALEDARMRAEEAMEEVRMRAEDVARLSKERAEEIKQRGQILLDEQKSRLGSAVDAGKKAAAEARKDISEDSGASI